MNRRIACTKSERGTLPAETGSFSLEELYVGDGLTEPDSEAPLEVP